MGERPSCIGDTPLVGQAFGRCSFVPAHLRARSGRTAPRSVLGHVSEMVGTPAPKRMPMHKDVLGEVLSDSGLPHHAITAQPVLSLECPIYTATRQPDAVGLAGL